MRSVLDSLTSPHMFTIDNYFPLAKIAVKFLVYYLALRAAGWLYKSLFSKSRFNAIPGPLPESWFKGVNFARPHGNDRSHVIFVVKGIWASSSMPKVFPFTRGLSTNLVAW